MKIECLCTCGCGIRFWKMPSNVRVRNFYNINHRMNWQRSPDGKGRYTQAWGELPPDPPVPYSHVSFEDVKIGDLKAKGVTV